MQVVHNESTDRFVAFEASAIGQTVALSCLLVAQRRISSRARRVAIAADTAYFGLQIPCIVSTLAAIPVYYIGQAIASTGLVMALVLRVQHHAL